MTTVISGQCRQDSTSFTWNRLIKIRLTSASWESKWIIKRYFQLLYISGLTHILYISIIILWDSRKVLTCSDGKNYDSR